jgi:hypothetical protein
MRTIAICLSAFVVGTLPAAAAEPSAPRKTYELKTPDAPTGSHLRRSSVEASEVPFDKRYHELTPEQQRLFKAQYEAMPDGDEPPYPVEGLQSIYGALAALAMRLQVEGPLEMHVDIDEKGTATAVSVLRSPGQDMARHAATVLMLAKYKPAVCGGKPCKMQLPVRTTLSRPTDSSVHTPFRSLPR